MISQKLQEAINVQIAAEMWSSNLYLSMSFYFKKLGYDGFANWMRKQSQEELEHAYDLADYVSKRGGVAKGGTAVQVAAVVRGGGAHDVIVACGLAGSIEAADGLPRRRRPRGRPRR